VDIPKVQKRSWDLVPGVRTVLGRAKQLGAGVVALAIGTLSGSAQAAVTFTQPPGLASKVDYAAGKLILQQPTSSPNMHAQHWSHSSHSSHSSHHSHYSSR